MNKEIIYSEDEIISANRALDETMLSGRYQDLHNHLTVDVCVGNVITPPLHGIEAASLWLTALPNAGIPNAYALWQTTIGNRLIIKWRQEYSYKDLQKNPVHCDGFGEMLYVGDGKFSYYYGTFNSAKLIWQLWKKLSFEQMLKISRQMKMASEQSTLYKANK